MLAAAVHAGRDAVGAAPAGHPDRAMYLDKLGNALQELSGCTGDVAALGEALVLFHRVQQDPGGAPSWRDGSDLFGHIIHLGIRRHTLTRPYPRLRHRTWRRLFRACRAGFLHEG